MTESGNTFEQQEPTGSNPMPEGSENIGTQETGDQTSQSGASTSETGSLAHGTSEPQAEQSSTGAESAAEAAPTGSTAEAAPEAASEAGASAESGASGNAGSTAEHPPTAESAPAASPAPAGDATGGAPAGDASTSEASPSEASTGGDAAGGDATEGEAVASDAQTEEAGGEAGEGRGRRGSRGSKLPQLSEPEMRELWSELAAKKENNEPIELEVISRNRGGVVCHYKGIEVFIPMSHWTLLRQPEESAQGESKGNNEKVLANVLEMTDFDTDARRVTATRRPILRRSLLDSLEVGQRIRGRVSSILDFGVFVDLGGIDGLLHTTEISYTRGRHPSQLLTKGEEVEVIVREIDKEKERIYLGRKELLPSPWEDAENKYPAASVQQGKVVGLGKMGAFVELEPGIEGFIRASELSWTKRIHNPKEVLKKGQEIPVKVLDVSGRKKRLSLSFRQAQENPWETLAQKYAVGTSWEGEIKEISNKGLVVGLEDVEGFLPRGRMGREAKRLPDMKAGDKINVGVIEVDPTRLSLIFGLPMPERGEGGEGGGGGRGERRGGGGRDRDRDDRRGPMPSAQPVNEMKSSETRGSFSIGDMIGQSIKEKLFPNMQQEEKPQPEPKQQPSSTQSAAAPSAPKAGAAEETISAAGASGTPPMEDQGTREPNPEIAQQPAAEPASGGEGSEGTAESSDNA